jgi:receptor expression-enhancing protein 5/6
MIFWIIFSFMMVCNGLVKTLLFFLPSFYAFKFLFLLWLSYPRTDGAAVLYEKVFKPYASQIKSAAKNFAGIK